MYCRQWTETASPERLLIVQTGSTLPALRARRGDFLDWFRRGLGFARGRYRRGTRGYWRIIATGRRARGQWGLSRALLCAARLCTRAARRTPVAALSQNGVGNVVANRVSRRAATGAIG